MAAKKPAARKSGAKVTRQRSRSPSKRGVGREDWTLALEASDVATNGLEVHRGAGRLIDWLASFQGAEWPGGLSEDEESIGPSPVTTEPMASLASAAARSRSEKLQVGGNATIILRLIARDGEPYARALLLSDLFARLAESLPRTNDGGRKDVRKFIDYVWKLYAPKLAPKSQAARVIRYDVMRLIDRFARDAASVRAIEATGNQTLLRLVRDEWLDRKSGPKEGSRHPKWELLRTWFKSATGLDFIEKRWSKDWGDPPSKLLDPDDFVSIR